MFIAVLQRLLYGYYCNKWLKDCVFAFVWNRSLLSNIASFAGWNFIGVSSAVLMTQGVSILLNIFCGVFVNAAQGIARQVQQSVTGFITNFMTALNPQITKSYASNDHEYMMKLVFQGARYSFYLMFAFSLPILIETETVLKLWLKIVPDYAVVFVRLTLILAISQTLSNTLITSMLATGEIKVYQIVVGGLQLLNFPLSYVALKFKLPPQSTVVIAIIISFACLGARLVILRGMIKLPVKKYLLNVFLNTITVAVLSTIAPFFIYLSMNTGLLRLGCICMGAMLSTILIIYLVGFSQNERAVIQRKLHSLRVKYGFIQ
jgi:Na+-driven multidrug efflux pump